MNKMIVIPEEVWRRNEDIERRKTVYPTLTQLEEDIHRLLEDANVGDYEKMTILSQLQHRYRNIYATLPPLSMVPPLAAATVAAPVPTTVDAASDIKNSDIQKVVNTFPQSWQKRATELLLGMKQLGRVEWDDDFGVRIDGAKVENANIGTLLRNVLRSRPYKDEPPGWTLFKEHVPTRLQRQDANTNVIEWEERP